MENLGRSDALRGNKRRDGIDMGSKGDNKVAQEQGGNTDGKLRMERGEDHAGLGYRELPHSELLQKAEVHAKEFEASDVVVIDTDFHSREEGDWQQILEYMDDDVIHHMLRVGADGGLWIPGEPSTGRVQEVSGRIQPAHQWRKARAANPDDEGNRSMIHEALDALGASHVILFPQHLLELGGLPFPELEVHIAKAYAKWLTERVLSQDPALLSSLYLPFSDPHACLEMVEEFGDKPGVCGFTITSNRYEATHKREYLATFAAMEERGLPLMFHSGFSFRERSMSMFNRFLALHAMSFPHFNMVHATNWIVSGMVERFPDLKLVFVEGGVAWIPFLMQRLDHTYMMRPSEAPMLKKLPSEYMRDFYYTTQPLEATSVVELRKTLDLINANDRLMYASDWPHWDWDPPSRIWDLPFLSEDDKRDILGRNAQRLFGLETAK